MAFSSFSSFSTWSLYISRDRICKTAHALGRQLRHACVVWDWSVCQETFATPPGNVPPQMNVPLPPIKQDFSQILVNSLRFYWPILRFHHRRRHNHVTTTSALWVTLHVSSSQALVFPLTSYSAHVASFLCFCNIFSLFMGILYSLPWRCMNKTLTSLF